ncbi:uncharacterized protein LOC133188381 isoform X2 [Saccostrea echinata]|uniref:uncharacterized protein LOC133188381 isoform X2 n=1 Tax=Saccostrea echinata TaxID=191078 RepID=UPI002A7F31E2|nr:uncharacterized protein LOC133188381 isoform X2 [Saccostrea echinata]
MELFYFFRIFISPVIVLFSCMDVVTALSFNVTAPSGTLLYPGQTFTASCNIWGYPPIDVVTNLTVNWKFKDSNICLYGDKMEDTPEKYQCSSDTKFDKDSFILSVSDVSSDDSGDYICEVKEKKKMSTMQSMIELNVVEPTTVLQITEIPETTTDTTMAGKGGCRPTHFQTFSVFLLVQILSFGILHT